jgi:hypothetical protein
LGSLPRVAEVDVLGALTRGNLASHLDPGREVVVPGELEPCPLHLATPYLGGGLPTNEDAAGRGGGLGEAFQHLEGKSTGGQRPETVEAPLGKVNGSASAVDSD